MIKEGFVNFIAALLVKLVVYFIVSLTYILIFLWAGIIKTFSWKYAAALTIVLLGVRIFIAEIFVKSEVKKRK